ncbi:MAG: hypothetical protein U0524_02630 [Candidatus Saccharimonadales bacterium]
MKILNRSKKVIKSAVIGGSAAAVLVASPLAFAHGSNGDRSGDNKGSYSRHASATSQQQKQKHDGDRQRNDNNWWWKQRHDRQKTCAEQQAAVSQRAASKADKSQKKLNGLNIVYSGTQTYATSGDVTVENYDTLNAKATASQTAATNAVGAITAPQLNCDDTSDATMQANKDALNDYYTKERTADKAIGMYRHDVMVLFNAAVES